MNFFGVGPTELFLILIVVLIVFGPERLPEIAKKIGGATRELTSSLDQVKNEMNDALNLSMEMDKARMIPPNAAPAPRAETRVDDMALSATALSSDLDPSAPEEAQPDSSANSA